MSLVIHGLGTAHPPAALTPADGLGVARFLAGPDVRASSWLGPVYEGGGVGRRFQVLGGPVVADILNGTTASGSPFLPTAANDGVGPTTAERMAVYAAEAGPLAVRAAAAAVAESDFPADSFTHLVTVSCTGFAAPGVDLALIRGLGLRPTVERTHVGFMGCHGAVNGLRVANAYAADPAARVLLCAVELCSLHYYYGSAADKLIANAIFADGAAAVVGCGGQTPPPNPLPAAGRGDRNPRLGASSPSPQRGGGRGEGSAFWTVAATGSCLIPESEREMAWTVGDHGFEMTLSRRVPGLIAGAVRPWLGGWLNDNGLTLDEVGSWAVHPGGPKILAAVEEGLALPTDALSASRAVFAEYGNMSSPTILFVLDRLRRAGARRPCVALAFGPGLVAEAALFR